MSDNQRIGLASAARFLGWTCGKFAAYHYQNRGPAFEIHDEKPVWYEDDLTVWSRSLKRKNKKVKHAG